MEGRILRGIGSFYTVCEYGTGTRYTLRAQKKLRKQGMTPTVGDSVQFSAEKNEDSDGWIERIHPRKNLLKRPPVANADLLIIVLACEPVPDMLLTDRLILSARRTGLTCALCVNKTDLDPAFFKEIQFQYRNTDIPVISASVKTGDGLSELQEMAGNRIVCFAGQSAVGKSSLIAALTGQALETNEVSRKTGRGRHTTRRCELISSSGGYIADTPGFSLFDLDDQVETEEIPEFYPEYMKVSENCRFQPCLHVHEPGCQVRAIVESGELDGNRWMRYCALISEAKEKRKGRYQ